MIRHHGETEPVPVEALTAEDWALMLVRAPLVEVGVPLPCEACEDVCTCGEDEDDDEDDA